MDKPKLTFESLVIEITRKCNMECAHCFRGDAQDVDIDYQHIDNLLDQAEVIGILEVTGGEPLLNLNAIEYILNGLCKRGIPLFGFFVHTNGLIYSNKFIKLMEWCKKIIDVSCANCLKDGDEYRADEATGRCLIDLSLDRYHEQHDKCLEHYQQYKTALADCADVRMIMGGNRPHKIGRAKNLEEALDVDFKFDFAKSKRVEILSKDYTPICPNFDTYHMFHEDQKIVCCRLYMNAFGELCIEDGGSLDYVRADAYPKICTTSDSIWDSILKYNKGKICCALFEQMATKNAQEKLLVEETLKWLATPDSTDEPPIFQKKQMEESAKWKEENDKRLYELEHPSSISEAINNVVEEFEKYKAMQELIKIQNRHEKIASDWKMVNSKARQYSYFDGDPRGGQSDHALIDSANNLCCHNCGEVIIQHGQIDTVMRSRIRCPHCKTTNLIPHKAKLQ